MCVSQLANVLILKSISSTKLITSKNIAVHRLAEFNGHQGSVYSLIRGETPETFVSGSGDRQVVEWSLLKPDEGKLLARVNTNIFTLLPLNDWKTMLIGQLQGGIHVIDLKEGLEKKLLAFHKKGVFDLKLINHGNTFLAAGGDGVLSVWSSESFELLQSIKIADSSLRSISLNSEKAELAIGCSDHHIYILSSENFKQLYKIEHHKSSVFSVLYSRDGSTLLAGSRDAFVSSWNVKEGYVLNQSVGAHMATVNQISLSPDGKWVATASLDKTIKIWNGKNLELLKVISNEKMKAHVNSVNCLLWLDEVTLVSGSDDRNIFAWKILAT